MRYLIVIVFAMSGISLQAQDVVWQQIISEKVPNDMRLAGSLYQLGRYAQTEPAAALAKAREWEMVSRQDGKIYIELEAVGSTDFIDVGPAEAAGLEIQNSWKRFASAWAQPSQLITVGEQLSEYYTIRATNNMKSEFEGPLVMNDSTYTVNGVDATGMKIMVIDLGFDTLSEAQAAGALPGVILSTDHTGSGLQANGVHGTACMETVYDHATGATYYADRIGSSSDLGNAVDDAISDGVDIISFSVSYFNTGWSDNEGGACEAMNDAAQAGILCFVSSGNYSDGDHYQGGWSDPDGDDWYNFSNGSERNYMVVGPGSQADVALQWAAGPDPFADDYDLFLYDSITGNLLASSTAAYDFESVTWTNNGANPVTVYVSILNDGSDENALEMFSKDAVPFGTSTATNATTSPSNCTEYNVICVGAVPQSLYGSAPGTGGINAGYSSQGPSNSGLTLPDVVGPTATTAFAYGGTWNGTSCSTPNCAGMAAVFWANNPSLSDDGVRKALLRQAEIFKDWGASGMDNIYGRGGMYVHDYKPNTIYILASSGNSSGTSSLPYVSLEQANTNAPSNKNAFFLDYSYEQPPAGSIVNKPMIYRAAPPTQTIIE